MGSVLVESMAQEGTRELGAKKVHPFFSKEPIMDPTRHSEISAQPPTVPDHDEQHDSAQSGSDSPNGRRKRRKPDSSVAQDAPGSKRPRRKRQGGGRQTTLVPTEQASDIATPEPNTTDIPTPPLSDAPMTSTEAPSQLAAEVPPDTTNKKILKWNPKTGTFGSPPKPKSKSLPSRIVCVKYGRDEVSRKDMGDKITQILDGKTLFPPNSSKSRAKKPKESAVKKAVGPAKATHPFFTGKAKQTLPATSENHKTAENRPSRQTVFTSTPLSPKKIRNPFTSDHQVPRFGIRTGTTKIPGAVYPLWPAKGMAHVRGLEVPVCSQVTYQDNAKKSKGYTVAVSPDESVLGGFCTSMDLTALRNSLPTNDDNFEPAPTELRIPTRHFESGRKAQKRIRSELRTLQLTPTEDEDHDIIGHGAPTTQPNRTHPAILRLYEELGTSLSAYDKSTCESMSWVQKYAPGTAAEVLQAGREAVLLKEWLQTLKVQSVGTGNADAGGAKGKTKSSAAPKKKRKKDKLDGFIIDSEEEANEMDEVSEDDDDWAPTGSGLTKKTVIRSGDAAAKGGKDQGRLTNAVVISGPHGSGKTAAVYAVAKELGFEIFEINPGSRRSGKDILEKVGDMTRNHLVQQHRADPTTEAEEDEVARDLKSGKQGMMTAFFQPKAAAASKKSTETTKGSQNQKQSLILLEEVDVLYQEDKQFWATLTEMMAQSKRPFIMTCNDENMVPLQTLNLHGIFRFSHPPTDLAIDHCLLAAANEGHLLKRSAVEALYKSRNNDLRATLVELNYWCQISVGDRKGGFDWFYLRWPKGSDRDENGDVVRVLSEDTYRKGMGWIGRDLTATCLDPLASEEEVMKQCWNSWTLDMGDWNNSLHLQSWADDVTRSATEPSQRLDALAALDEFCTSMSDADLISSGSLGTRFQEVLDPELPEIPTKTRDDFIVGRRLLEADPKPAASTPSVGLSISLKSLTRQRLFKLSSTPDVTSSSTLKPLAEDRAVSVLGDSFEHCTTPMTRMDLALAFDPIAVNENAAASSHLDPSVFDRTMKLIVLDIAPWVRGIVEFDNKLMQERLKLSNLLSEGGKRKRMRTTRSAYSALEGGERRTTRRERYFGDCLNTAFVRRTAGDAWQEAVEAIRPKESAESAPSSPSSPGSSLA
ncbi:hypothetical protein CDV36_014766 [Fusarium kuroshium]|uniref:AAA+ ATPase domain-containing protein n=1 Tax=Fusarium kuroshium TaxID=2010991 RepID=A0A3M2REP2_9HYPO|nr:hypothetical protein CDV36_014766 [Fusarium kuroshium]